MFTMITFYTKEMYNFEGTQVNNILKILNIPP